MPSDLPGPHQHTRSLFTTTQLSLTKMPKLLGSVPYLNARPLHWTIKDPVVFFEPDALSVELAEGRLHAGLVPLFSVLENPHLYHVMDSYAIGSLNAVYSVVMAHALPIVRIKTVSLDPVSRTSNPLARILLEKYFRIRPEYVSPDVAAEGQVMIGDPAIAYRHAHPDERYLDLAESWHTHTGLPFVFAVWAIRRDAPNAKGIAKTLRAAAVEGLAERGVIARNRFEQRYLTEHLYYHLGPRQKRAIQVYAADLVEIGLLAHATELSYI